MLGKITLSLVSLSFGLRHRPRRRIALAERGKALAHAVAVI